MKKLTLFIILISAFASISIAQQKIVFEEIVDTMKYNPIQKNYVLPKLVSFTFSNGINQQLILDKIKDDSLIFKKVNNCLLYTSPSPRDRQKSRMPSSA